MAAVQSEVGEYACDEQNTIEPPPPPPQKQKQNPHGNDQMISTCTDITGEMNIVVFDDHIWG